MARRPRPGPKPQVVPFERREGSRYPATVHDLHIREVNTQRFAAGARGGTTSGQGPALDSK